MLIEFDKQFGGRKIRSISNMPDSVAKVLISKSYAHVASEKPAKHEKKGKR